MFLVNKKTKIALASMICTLGFCGSAFVSAPVQAKETVQKIDTQSVQRFLTSMEKTIKAQDIKQMSTYFSPDAKIKMILPKEMGGTRTMALKEYLSTLNAGWKTLKNAKYQYEVSNIKIKVLPGNRALVTDTTTETMTIQGKKIVSEAKESFLLILVKGQYKVKALSGKVTVKGL